MNLAYARAVTAINGEAFVKQYGEPRIADSLLRS
jgi:hypothetical protein